MLGQKSANERKTESSRPENLQTLIKGPFNFYLKLFKLSMNIIILEKNFIKIVLSFVILNISNYTVNYNNIKILVILTILFKL